MHKIAVWCGDNKIYKPDVDVIDGNEMLYHIMWPKIGTIKQLLENFTKAVMREYQVIVVFDRYVEGSIKTHEHLRRTGDVVCPKLNVTLEMKIPTWDSVMRSDHNKTKS